MKQISFEQMDVLNGGRNDMDCALAGFITTAGVGATAWIGMGSSWSFIRNC